MHLNSSSLCKLKLDFGYGLNHIVNIPISPRWCPRIGNLWKWLPWNGLVCYPAFHPILTEGFRFLILRRTKLLFHWWTQICILWRVDWNVHLRILLLLLSYSFRHGWVNASIFLLRLHGLRLLWILLDAGFGWIQSLTIVRSQHLSCHQMWVGYHELLGSYTFY